MSLKEKILNEMVESKEDKIVREIKKETNFDEDSIRKQYAISLTSEEVKK